MTFIRYFLEKENISVAQWCLMKCSINSASDIIKCTLNELDNPAISSLQCGPDYLRSLFPLSDNTLKCCEQSLKSFEVRIKLVLNKTFDIIINCNSSL